VKKANTWPPTKINPVATGYPTGNTTSQAIYIIWGRVGDKKKLKIPIEMKTKNLI
jgi:hypothetical protein